MKLTAIIVDDEPPARQIIREYLQDFPQIECTGECANGRQALAAIHEKQPDLVFLDIQMPGLSGLDVLQRLEYFPRVIFTTAYDQYALKAFEVNAVDYLLKPFSRERFRKAVRRVLNREHYQNTELDHLLSLLQSQQGSEAPPKRLYVRVGQKIVPIKIEEILWIEAAGDYCKIHLAGKSYICNSGLGALEARLDPARFTRVHRSAIVALSALKHLESDGEGGYFATLDDGSKVRVSRSFAPKFRNLIL